ncbi:MAG TPA: DUF4340 domain-containing protein [Verrucomicrobiae bacterium]|nr:DUF4340 domain-containing protein [Verrucomicrobiae bacterium]
MKKPVGLLVALVLFGIFGGLWLWSNKKEEAKSKAPPAADTSTKLQTIPEDQFQEIRIKKGADTVVMRRDNGKWAITEPKPYQADPDASSSLVSSLAGVAADKLIDAKPANLADYGLASPQLDLTVVRKDGKTNELQIGDETPTNSGFYAKEAGGDGKVYTIMTYVKTGLDKGLNDLRDKRLLHFDQDKITRIDLAAKGVPVQFGKNNNNQWQILQPKPLRADSGSVDSLISKLKDAKMDLASPDADAAKKFAEAPKIASVSITDVSGTETLEVHQTKDHDYYAKSSVVDGVYKIPGDVGDAVNKGLDDFRNKKLYDFGFSDPSKLEIVNNGAASAYTKSGDKWMSGSKTMDNSTVQTLIDKLRDLSADKFVDAGGGNTVFEGTVTAGGKSPEKVIIRKQGDQYFAQREGEPSIYQLTAGSVAEVQTAASGIKEQAPAAAPKKK